MCVLFGVNFYEIFQSITCIVEEVEKNWVFAFVMTVCTWFNKCIVYICMMIVVIPLLLESRHFSGELLR